MKKWLIMVPGQMTQELQAERIVPGSTYAELFNKDGNTIAVIVNGPGVVIMESQPQ